jgi:hypothetical protein
MSPAATSLPLAWTGVIAVPVSDSVTIAGKSRNRFML